MGTLRKYTLAAKYVILAVFKATERTHRSRHYKQTGECRSLEGEALNDAESQFAMTPSDCRVLDYKFMQKEMISVLLEKAGRN